MSEGQVQVGNYGPNGGGGGGGGGTPGGADTQVQFNNTGAFGGISNGSAGQVLTSNGAGVMPSFQPAAGGPGVIQRAVITLSAAQIKNWVATPIAIVPAQGAGTSIMPIAAWGQFKHGATPYSGTFTNLEIDIYPQGGIDGWLYNTLSDRIGTLFTGTSDGTLYFQSIDQTDVTTYDNVPLLLSAAFFNAGELTNGDGTLTVTVYYSVVTLL